MRLPADPDALAREEPKIWLWAAVLASLLLSAIYLVTHPRLPSPGLFMAIVEQVQATGYALPRRIPHFTPGGIPFSYPPLAFYVIALAQAITGAPLLWVMFGLSTAFTAAYVAVSYRLAAELLGSVRQAGVAALLVAVTPAVFRWHLDPSGAVRALAFLFSLLGVYAGVRLFRDRSWRWLPAAVGLFALTVLTHPVYTTFFAVSYVCFYLGFDRSVAGLGRGAVVAVGGLLIAAPWWGLVLARHGVDPFFAAAGTHGGIGASLLHNATVLAKLFSYWDLWTLSITSLYSTALGSVYLLARRRYALPIWLVGVAAVIGANLRFVLLIEAFIAAVVLFEVLLPAIRNGVDVPERRIAFAVGTVGVVIAAATLAGALFAGNAYPGFVGGGGTMPGAAMNEDDAAAMRWIESNTDPEASFVVLGPVGEQVAAYADRTIEVGHWGAEWKGRVEYERQLAMGEELTACSDATCLSSVIGRNDLDPDYVYVSTASFDAASLGRDPAYERVYERGRVSIWRYAPG